MTSGAVVAALALLLLLAAGALSLAGEIWWAARGAGSGDPQSAPYDHGGGPAPGGGSGPVVVWLGDSTAAGVGASCLGGTLPEQVARELATPVRLRVLAQSGARVADVLRTQLPQVAATHPEQVFVSVGANDATHLTPRSFFRRDYGQLLAELPASVTRVVLLGVPDMGAPPRLAQPLRAVAGWRGRALAGDIRRLAATGHSAYVDIAGSTGPTFRRHPGQYFAADRYHPNDAGYRQWAAAVTAALGG